jgi:tol-pal system protein YbgF
LKVRAISRSPQGHFVVAALLLAGAAGCGGPSTQVQEDLASLRQDLAAARRTEDELRTRIERLEARGDLSPAPARITATAAAPLTDDTVPSLPVVHLRPEGSDPSAAPDVDTHIPIRDGTPTRSYVIDQTFQDSEKPVDLNAVLARQRRTESPTSRPETPARSAGTAGQEDAEFQKAVVKYNDGKYPEATAAFKAFAERYPGHQAASEALFLAGMSETATNHCLDAEPLFQTVLKAYPEAPAAGRSLLALGKCEANVGHDDSARTYFGRVLSEYPHTAEASQAKAAMADLSRGSR